MYRKKMMRFLREGKQETFLPDPIPSHELELLNRQRDMVNKTPDVQHVPIIEVPTADHPGFAIAMQHSSMHSTENLCKLLCVSKAVCSIVLQQCVGQLSLFFSLEETWEVFKAGLEGKQVQQLPTYTKVKDAAAMTNLGSWIAKYGRIMKSLSVHNTLGGALKSMAAAPIATSLLEAAKYGPLQLQSLELRCNDAIGLILTKLSAHRLTQLDIHWDSMIMNDKYRLNPLSQLTGLRQLTISRSQGKSEDPGVLDPIIPALAALSNLTMLELKSTLKDSRSLQQLPQQLQSLQLHLPKQLQYTHAGISLQTASSTSSPAAQATAALQLSYLTALTCLTLGGTYSVNNMDTLPVNLRVLKLDDCSSCEPLVALSQLQQLSMARSSTPAQELQQLSGRTALTGISLSYVDGNDLDLLTTAAASAVWAGLPSLRSLTLGSYLDQASDYDEVWEVPLTTAIVSRIAGMSSLLELQISNKTLSDVAAAELPATLLRLTALTALHLHELCVGDGPEDPDTCRLGISYALLCSMLRLPMMLSLTLSSVDVRYTAEAARLGNLSGATQLTSLCLHDCDLTDNAAKKLLAGLGGLEDLTLSCNKGITGVAAPAVAKLTKLTSLHLQTANMQLEDMQCLTCLCNLVICDLPGSVKCWWI